MFMNVLLFCLILCRLYVSEIVDADETGNMQVSYQQVDLSNWRSIRSLTQRILDSETRLDVLINNAGNTRCRNLSSLE